MEKELRAEQAAGKAWIGEMGGGGAEGIPPHSPPSFSEQYQCCGLLQQDLTELCARAGIISIPRVTVRPFPAAGEGLGLAGGQGRGGLVPQPLFHPQLRVRSLTGWESTASRWSCRTTTPGVSAGSSCEVGKQQWGGVSRASPPPSTPTPWDG